MNTALAFLGGRWHSLGLESYGQPADFTSLVLTPGFRASSNVVFVIFPKGSSAPLWVAKVARLAESAVRLCREAELLRSLQAHRPGGLDSAPRVVAFEQDARGAILVETALDGQLVDPSLVRARPAAVCASVLDWLVDLAQPAAGQPLGPRFDQSLARLAALLPLSTDEARCLDQTRALAGPAFESMVPVVMEHGDLSHPNLFWRHGGALGVIDWECADPQGLPACDLFFFLTYAAFARARADSLPACLAAFEAAFFGQSAWARPYVMRYAERLALPVPVLRALFVLTWIRVLAMLLTRLGAGEAGQPAPAGTAAWLRGNRFYALWRCALDRQGELLGLA